MSSNIHFITQAKKITRRSYKHSSMTNLRVNFFFVPFSTTVHVLLSCPFHPSISPPISVSLAVPPRALTVFLSPASGSGVQALRVCLQPGEERRGDHRLAGWRMQILLSGVFYLCRSTLLLFLHSMSFLRSAFYPCNLKTKHFSSL
jgi:hypothetical protein